MATPFEFTNLSPYEQLATQQLLDQSRRNPLQEMISAYQAPQKYAQEQAAVELSAQIQRANLDALRRAGDPNSPENKMKLALDQARLNELQRDPNIAFQNRLQEDALRGIIDNRNPNFIIQPTVDPAILAARAEAEAAGGIPSTAYKQSDFIPLFPARGNIPAMGISPEAGRAAAAAKTQAKVAEIQARANAAGIPGKVLIDEDGNPQFIPTRAVGGQAPIMPDVKFPQNAAGGRGGLTANARSKLIQDYTDLTGISPDKVLDDVNDGTISLDKMAATVGSLQGARKIPTSEFKSFKAHESMLNDFKKVENAINLIEKEFGPVKGRWTELMLATGLSETDPKIADAFSLINSLSATQIHDKYGGALTPTEEARAIKWALDTSLPGSTLKSRLRSAISGLESDKAAFRTSLKARNINAPNLFNESSSDMVEVIHSDGRTGSIPSNQLEGALKAGFLKAGFKQK